MQEFAIKGVRSLAGERLSLGSDFEMFAVNYFDIASRYCLNQTDLNKLTAAFATELELDIIKLNDEVSPLGFAYRFPKFNLLEASKKA
jgi:hypothetical protein